MIELTSVRWGEILASKQIDRSTRITHSHLKAESRECPNAASGGEKKQKSVQNEGETYLNLVIPTKLVYRKSAASFKDAWRVLRRLV
ncbi:hypothetical protein F443_09247 [Phytophthora nicotianae P1569]|uniref:Uncharacterized protein n=1 Tax=Phytophthora nicotianae P1569 TaxID=1317065 RepID=V9F7M9_PHYNI|nr:hypothetical protein F443_09247 [Phytophthora nicotianae P1569]